MAVKFLHTIILSVFTAVAVGTIFYVLSISRGAVSEAYTVMDTNLGSVFIFLLSFIIGLSLWPRILEKRA